MQFTFNQQVDKCNVQFQNVITANVQIINTYFRFKRSHRYLRQYWPIHEETTLLGQCIVCTLSLATVNTGYGHHTS